MSLSELMQAGHRRSDPEMVQRPTARTQSHEHRQAFRQFAALLVICGIFFIPGVLSSFNSISDPFTYRNVAFLAAEAHADKLRDRQIAGTSYGLEDHSGYDALLQVLYRTTGISDVQLMYLSVGAIVVPVLYFAIAQSLFGSVYISFLLAVYAAFDPTMGLTQYSTHNYAWANTLFLMFVLVYVELLKNGKSPSRIGTLFAVYVASFLTNWTIPVWAIMVLIFGTLVTGIVRKGANPSGAWSRNLSSLALSCLVVYLGFSQIFYHDIMGALRRGRGLEAVPRLADEVLSIFGRNRDVRGYADFLTPPTGSALWDYTRLARLALLFLSVAVPCAWVVWRAIVRHDRTRLKQPAISFGFTTILAGIGAALAYASYGHLSIRFAVFMFPFVAVAFLRACPGSRVAVSGFVVAVACLALVQYAAAMSVLAPSRDARNEANLHQSTAFVWQTYGYDVRVLSDLNTVGMLLLEAGRNGRSFLPCYFTPPRYASVIDFDGPVVAGDDIGACQVLVLNEKASTLPTASVGWDYFQPLVKYREQIEQNPSLVRQYDDGKAVVYEIRH